MIIICRSNLPVRVAQIASNHRIAKRHANNLLATLRALNQLTLPITWAIKRKSKRSEERRVGK
ncbi:hypothetical protein HMPREF1577_01526, partial [Gardnerella pickettii JCP8017A]